MLFLLTKRENISARQASWLRKDYRAIIKELEYMNVYFGNRISKIINQSYGEAVKATLAKTKGKFPKRPLLPLHRID